MKLKLIVTMLFGCISLANAQSTNTDTLAKKVTGLTEQVEKLKKLITENSSDKSVDVGTLKLIQTKDVQVYTTKDATKAEKYKELRKVEIESIRVITKDGYIISISINTKDKGIFFNNRAPIELSQARIAKQDMLSNQNDQYINIFEILSYVETKPYVPSDDNILLTAEAPTHTYTKGVGINTIFDIRLYSDALGLFGGKSNGLIQTDASLKYVFCHKNLRNTGLFFANYFKFNFSASKFDSKLGFTDSAKFSRTSLFQKSYISTDLAINIINGWIGKRTLNSFYLDAGAGISLSKLAKKTDTVSLLSPHIFLEPGFTFAFGDNLGMSIYSRFIYNYNYSSDIDQHLYGGKQFFIKPTVSMFWNPLEDKGSKIFARVSYVNNTSDKASNFCQIQFGYSLQLTSLAKKL